VPPAAKIVGVRSPGPRTMIGERLVSDDGERWLRGRLDRLRGDV
jgi:hypothetical protein